MTEQELTITQLKPRSASLLQIYEGNLEHATPIAARALGVQEAGFSSTDGPRAYSIGPAEWLLIDYSVSEMRRHLSHDLGRALLRVTDVSYAFARLRVAGAAAREVLLADISSPSAVSEARPGQYAHTRLGQLDVMLQCISANSFDLYLDRSLVKPLTEWLTAQYEAQASLPGPNSLH